MDTHNGYASDSGSALALMPRFSQESDTDSAAVPHAVLDEESAVLVAGIAHDLNNVFAKSMARLDRLARGEVGLEDSIASLCRLLNRGAEMAAILQDGDPEPNNEAVCLHGPLQEAVWDVGEGAPFRVRLDSRPNAYFVKARSVELYRIFYNLCNNARRAIERSGPDSNSSLRVSAYCAIHKDSSGDPLPARFVRVKVEDTGEGMDAETRLRISQRGFTTKSGPGHGEGLAIVHSTIRRLGGTIRVESEPGRGTTFAVELPTASSSISPRPRAVLSSQADKSSRRVIRSVLVVDDEEDLREFNAHVLEGAGYQALKASSGIEAIELFLHQKPDLVLLDLTMPGMSGADVVIRLREIDSKTPILVLSGKRAPQLPVDGFLKKPCPPPELLASISGVACSMA